MRLFFAINLPDDVREHLHKLQSELRHHVTAPASWTRPEQFHITVKFLGECDQSRSNQLIDLLKKAPLPSIGSLHASDLQIFPPHRPARVLGAKFASDRPETLHKLHRQLEDICAALDFPRENREFHPHATFARLRIPRRIPHAVYESVASIFPGPEFSPATIDLMESKLSPKGSQYTRLASINLAD